MTGCHHCKHFQFGASAVGWSVVAQCYYEQCETGIHCLKNHFHETNDTHCTINMLRECLTHGDNCQDFEPIEEPEK